jgi:hypothetical protein
VTVYDPYTLHERVGHHRTDQRITLPLEQLFELRSLGRPALAILLRTCPHQSGQGWAGYGTLGVMHGCFDLTAVANDGTVREQRVNVTGSHCRDPGGVESVERSPEPGAAPEHRLPGQSALKYGQRQGLE